MEAVALTGRYSPCNAGELQAECENIYNEDIDLLVIANTNNSLYLLAFCSVVGLLP